MDSDSLIISNARFSVRIGCSPGERAAPQPLVVSASLFLDLSPAGQSASLDQTVSWNDALSVIGNLAESREWILVEEFAEEASRSLFNAFPRIKKIEIEVHKFPFKEVQHVGVKILRER